MFYFLCFQYEKQTCTKKIDGAQGGGPETENEF